MDRAVIRHVSVDPSLDSCDFIAENQNETDGIYASEVIREKTSHAYQSMCPREVISRIELASQRHQIEFLLERFLRREMEVKMGIHVRGI